MYKKINNVVGWIIFAVAAFTYCSTIEPTASFWDCPEFITTAAKMEVGHPPGAPFFMLLGNLFTHFASDASQVAKMVNCMSALLSAGCILFLFWSITYLTKKLLTDGEEPSSLQTLIVMAAGVCGALIYTWSDTFWFSAVEGEVYAFSSFLTALVFWLMLKWDARADEVGSDRWIVLIAYLVGLSIGVHLLNLLCIPAMVLVAYYNKAKNANVKGSLMSLLASAVIIVVVLYGIVPGMPRMAGYFELFFVNTLGLPFNTGLYVYLLLTVLSLIVTLYVTGVSCNENSEIQKRGKIKRRRTVSMLTSVALLGIPFLKWGWGAFIVGIVLLIVLGWVMINVKWVTQRVLNTAALCMTMIVIGYASYAVIVIRSYANPPMDQNSPEDVFALNEYLSREQYGDRPLFWGPTYGSHPNVVEKNGMLVYETKNTAPVYQKKEKNDPNEKGEFVKVRDKFEYVYPANACMLFPRIYDEGKASRYKAWIGETHEHEVTNKVPGMDRPDVANIPSQKDNITYFLSYQMNFMYWRYFMWNFAGRQNDIQANNGPEWGNWITGFSVLDNARLGNQDLLPTDLKENKGHNVFYCMPLLLGVIGLLWQALRDKKSVQQFWVVFFLFFMTGIAIVLYLNQTPDQPRERDYAYAGSFYAFAMWCGMGIAALYELLTRKFRNSEIRKLGTIAVLVSAIAVIVPLQLVSQTWDDHDRSDRYVCRDFGLNYLETVPKDGVIFTNGDNDTFPLWYNEDTEGKRTDVRVCNLSYLQTDWYIDQMKRPAYAKPNQSSALPISWNRLQYTSGSHEYTDVNPSVYLQGEEIKMSDLVKRLYEENPDMAKEIWGDDPFELHTAIHKFVLKENIPVEYKDLVADLPSCLPSDTLHVTVDKDAVRRSDMMIPDGMDIPDRMQLDLSGKDRVYKSFMMMLEMISESNFSRPLYMSTTVGPDNYGNLYHHFLQEGIAWRITPFTFIDNHAQRTKCDSQKMYDNMMNKYQYGNLRQKGLYIDETTMRMCYTHRRWFSVLINALIQERKFSMAKKAIEKCETEIPSYNVPHDIGSGSLDIAEACLVVGMTDRGLKILADLEKKSSEYVTWYLAQNDRAFAVSCRECYTDFSALYGVMECYKKYGITDKASVLENKLENMYQRFAPRATALGFQI